MTKGYVDVSEWSYLNVRTGPGTNFEIIGKLLKGTLVMILAEKYGWYEVLFAGRTAWINGHYIEGEKEKTLGVELYGTITLPTGWSCGIKVGAGPHNPVIGRAENGTRVEVLDKQNGHYRCKFANGMDGWVRSDFVKLDSIPPLDAESDTYLVRADFGGICLRNSASDSSPFGSELEGGDRLQIVKQQGEWAFVETSDGKSGWIRIEILKAILLDYESSATVTPPATPGNDTGSTGTDPGSTGTGPGTPPTGRNDIEGLDLPSNGGALTDAMAGRILDCLGYGRFDSDKIRKFQLSRFGSWNEGKKYKSGVLDANTKDAILEMGRMLKEVLAKYPQATISKDDPAFKTWAAAAAQNISNMPELRKADGSTLSKGELMTGILKIESGQHHWRNGRMVISSAGAMGFMQIMPFHIPSAGNIFDPSVNLAFGAKYINGCLGRSDFRVSGETDSGLLGKALAAYNGGPNRKAFKNQTWDEIVRRRSIPSGCIGYAIKIKKTMGLPLSAAEKAF